MFLFFAAFAVQWCYPDDMSLRVNAAVFILIAILLVAWCIWTARDRCEFWWFQPDPNQVEYMELEEEEEDGEVSPGGILGLRSFLRRFT